MLLSWLQTAIRARDATDDPFDRALAIGVVGCLAALLLAGFAGSFMVRGVQFTVVALAALGAGIAMKTE